MDKQSSVTPEDRVENTAIHRSREGSGTASPTSDTEARTERVFATTPLHPVEGEERAEARVQLGQDDDDRVSLDIDMSDTRGPRVEASVRLDGTSGARRGRTGGASHGGRITMGSRTGESYLAKKVDETTEAQMEGVIEDLKGEIRAADGIQDDQEIWYVRLDFSRETYIYRIGQDGVDISTPIQRSGPIRDLYNEGKDLIEGKTRLLPHIGDPVYQSGFAKEKEGDHVREYTQISTKDDKDSGKGLDSLLAKRFAKDKPGREHYNQRIGHAKKYCRDLRTELIGHRGKGRELSEKLENVDWFAVSLALAYAPIGLQGDREQHADALERLIRDDFETTAKKTKESYIHKAKKLLPERFGGTYDWDAKEIHGYETKVAALIRGDASRRIERNSVEQMIVDEVLRAEGASVPATIVSDVVGPLSPAEANEWEGVYNTATLDSRRAALPAPSSSTSPSPTRSTTASPVPQAAADAAPRPVDSRSRIRAKSPEGARVPMSQLPPSARRRAANAAAAQNLTVTGGDSKDLQSVNPAAGVGSPEDFSRSGNVD